MIPEIPTKGIWSWLTSWVIAVREPKVMVPLRRLNEHQTKATKLAAWERKLTLVFAKSERFLRFFWREKRSPKSFSARLSISEETSMD